jgi:hypothetical protein
MFPYCPNILLITAAAERRGIKPYRLTPNKNIVASKTGSSSTFKIPLSSPDNSYFMASGRFAVTFSVIVDIDSQFVFNRNDNMILVFTNGSAEIDFASLFGAPDVSLTNKTIPQGP